MEYFCAKTGIKVVLTGERPIEQENSLHDGDGLHSQEHRCRDYATARGYTVEAVFHDDVSGGGDLMKRPGMVAMLNFMENAEHDGHVVIFDDLKRFARDASCVRRHGRSAQVGRELAQGPPRGAYQL